MKKLNKTPRELSPDDALDRGPAALDAVAVRALVCEHYNAHVSGGGKRHVRVPIVCTIDRESPNLATVAYLGLPTTPPQQRLALDIDDGFLGSPLQSYTEGRCEDGPCALWVEGYFGVTSMHAHMPGATPMLPSPQCDRAIWPFVATHVVDTLTDAKDVHLLLYPEPRPAP